MYLLNSFVVHFDTQLIILGRPPPPVLLTAKASFKFPDQWTNCKSWRTKQWPQTWSFKKTFDAELCELKLPKVTVAQRVFSFELIYLKRICCAGPITGWPKRIVASQSWIWRGHTVQTKSSTELDLTCQSYSHKLWLAYANHMKLMLQTSFWTPLGSRDGFEVLEPASESQVHWWARSERNFERPVGQLQYVSVQMRFALQGHDAVANLVLDDVQEQFFIASVTKQIHFSAQVCWEFEEYLRDPEDPYKVQPLPQHFWIERVAQFGQVSDETRTLGLVVARGTSAFASAVRFQSSPTDPKVIHTTAPKVMLICPVDGTEEIANPFASA